MDTDYVALCNLQKDTVVVFTEFQLLFTKSGNTAVH